MEGRVIQAIKCVLLTVACWMALSTPPTRGYGQTTTEFLQPDPSLAVIEHRRCDVLIRPSDAPDLETILNGPGNEFCFAPGDYTCPGGEPDCAGAAPDVIRITTSGSAAVPKTMRPNLSPMIHAYAQSQQVVLPRIAFNSYHAATEYGHWRVQGLVIRPRTIPEDRDRSRYGIVAYHLDDSIFDLNWVDLSKLGTQGSGTINGIVLVNDCDHNFIQQNLITDPERTLGVDSAGIGIGSPKGSGLDNDGNLVLDNECRNLSCVVLAAGYSSTNPDPTENCRDPSFEYSYARRTLIEGNDAFTTREYYHSCTLGNQFAPVPALGSFDECACTEALFESKHNPGPGFENVWRNNRAWGTRGGHPGETGCGGSGHSGGGFSSGNNCHGNEIYEDNRVWDTASTGFGLSGENLIVRHNLAFDIKKNERQPTGYGIHLGLGARAARVSYNRIIADRESGYLVENAFEDRADDIRASCNVIVEPTNSDAHDANGEVRADGGLTPRGTNVRTERNYFYANRTPGRGLTGPRHKLLLGYNLGIPTDANFFFDSVSHAKMASLCIEHGRWTGKRVICLKNAVSTANSPHTGCESIGRRRIPAASAAPRAPGPEVGDRGRRPRTPRGGYSDRVGG